MLAELSRVLRLDPDLLRRIAAGDMLATYVLDVPQTAALLGVGQDTIRKALAGGGLPGAKVGREWRIALPLLLEHLRGTDYPAPTEGPPSDG